MRNAATRSEANRLYAAAHLEQYKNKDLPAALALYQEIIAAHPDTPEAGYSRGQIRAIATRVVPRQELLDAQVELVLASLDPQP